MKKPATEAAPLLTSLSPNPARYSNLTHSFIAQGVSLQGGQVLDTTEEIEIILKPLSDVIDLTAQGKILNIMHLGTLFLALHRSGKLK